MTLDALLEKQNSRSKTKLTLAQAQAMIADYQSGSPITPLLSGNGISQNRFYAILAAAGLSPRTKAESIALWHKSNQTSFNPGPNRQRQAGRLLKAATTPKAHWVDLADACPNCDGVFAITAPSIVAERLHIVWQQKHPCTQERQS